MSLDVPKRVRLTIAGFLLAAGIAGVTIAYVCLVVPQREKLPSIREKPKGSNIMVGRTLIKAANAVSVECGVPPPGPNADPNEYWARLNPPTGEEETDAPQK